MSTPPDLRVSKAQDVGRTYKNTPKLRALAEGVGAFVPGVTAFNTYLVERLSQLERERTEALFAYLDEGGAELTPELIESDDFLHCFTITMRAAQRTRRKEKIRLFARLLASATAGDGITDVDEYEELLATLDDVSCRELILLTTLEHFQETASREVYEDGEPENDFQRAERFWPDFTSAAAKASVAPPDEVRSLMNRLNRSGLYETHVGYLDMQHGSGYLTPRYYRLRSLIADTQGNILGDDVL